MSTASNNLSAITQQTKLPLKLMVIKPAHQEALQSIVDTLIARTTKIPSINENPDFWQRSATDLDVDNMILKSMSILPQGVQSQFRQLLELLSSPLPGLLLLSKPTRFAALSFSKREQLLLKWSTSRLPILRCAFASLKQMTCFIYYGTSHNGSNPNWHHIGYPGPPNKLATIEKPPLQITSHKRENPNIDCDTLVIGSGAGGGVIADTLSAAGHDVVVIDKGPFVDLPDRDGTEQPMTARMWEAGAMQTTKDRSISLFAGSNIGGGTTINWSVCWRPERKLLEQWATQAKLPHLLDKEFQQCIDDIFTQIAAQPAKHHNAQSLALMAGSKSLGYGSGPLQQNVKGCELHQYQQCGFCLFGCRYGNKQDSTESFLKKAQNQGARIFANTQAQQLIHKNGTVTEVIAVTKNDDGIEREIKIKAKRVVLCGGAINTPALLLASGFDHNQIGKNLHLHPAALVLGLYADKINSWYGGMMTSYSDGADDLDGQGYGCKLEPSPLHPGLLATVLPWQNSTAHKQLMTKAPHFGAFAVITRDKHSGKIQLDKHKRPQVIYRMSSYDRKHSIQGMATAAAIHAAAQAEQVVLTHHQAITLKPSDIGNGFTPYYNALLNQSWSNGNFPLFSAHQMGSCRMGGDNKTSPVDPEGRLRGTTNLYVSDASVFPSASGINPMITIQALARSTANGIATQSN